MKVKVTGQTFKERASELRDAYESPSEKTAPEPLAMSIAVFRR